MARLHSKKHGQSGSKRPSFKVAPDWVEYPAHEIEDLVVKLHKAGHNSTTIGHMLRDSYGIPRVSSICGKTIGKILAASGEKVDYPDDLLALIRKAVGMIKHLQVHKQDGSNITKLIHVESKIKRLVKYYIRTGKLPVGWRYQRETAALLVK